MAPIEIGAESQTTDIIITTTDLMYTKFPISILWADYHQIIWQNTRFLITLYMSVIASVSSEESLLLVFTSHYFNNDFDIMALVQQVVKWLYFNPIGIEAATTLVIQIKAATLYRQIAAQFNVFPAGINLKPAAY